MAYLNSTYSWTGRAGHWLWRINSRACCTLVQIWFALRAKWIELNSKNGLPGDMLDQECTTVLCFRMSVAINIWTGGADQMTFSARSYGAKNSAKTIAGRLFWSFVSASIDLACGVLRGEAYHCEAAWTNHNAR